MRFLGGSAASRGPVRLLGRLHLSPVRVPGGWVGRVRLTWIGIDGAEANYQQQLLLMFDDLGTWNAGPAMQKSILCTVVIFDFELDWQIVLATALWIEEHGGQPAARVHFWGVRLLLRNSLALDLPFFLDPFVLQIQFFRPADSDPPAAGLSRGYQGG